MAFIPALNTARVSLQMRWRDHVTVNVFHVQRTDAWNFEDLLTLGSAFKGWWEDERRALTSSRVTLESILLRDLTTATSASAEFTDGLPLEGTASADCVSNSVALVTTLRTGLSGRNFRGRVYSAGVPLGQLADPNFVTEGYAELTNDSYSALFTAIGTMESAALVVASFHVNNEPRILATLTPVRNFTTNTKLDNQRRRMKGAS